MYFWRLNPTRPSQGAQRRKSRSRVWVAVVETMRRLPPGGHRIEPQVVMDSAFLVRMTMSVSALRRTSTDAADSG